jgi:hypothetical protein
VSFVFVCFALKGEGKDGIRVAQAVEYDGMLY